MCRHRQPYGGAPTTEAGKWRIVDFSFVSSFPVSTLGSWQGQRFHSRQLAAWVMGSGLARTSEPSVGNAPEKQSAEDIGGQYQTDMWTLESTIQGYSATPWAHPGRSRMPHPMSGGEGSRRWAVPGPPVGNCELSILHSASEPARVDSCQCGHGWGHRCSLKIARRAAPPNGAFRPPASQSKTCMDGGHLTARADLQEGLRLADEV